ncbi:MAG: hypothetical protein AAB651_00405, partial [Patescibacteria group bacterium]
MKKIILISGISLAVIAFGLGVYLAWEKSREILQPPASFPMAPTFPFSPPAGGDAGAGADSGISVPKLRAVSDYGVFDYWIVPFMTSTSSAQAGSGQMEILYVNESGQIFKVIESGDDVMATSEPVSGLRSVYTSKDGKFVIVKSGDLTSPKFNLYNVATGVWQPLSENITAIDFSPDSQKIAYLEKTSTNSTINNLTIKDLTAAKPKTTKILSLNQKDFELKWLTSDQILLISKPSAQLTGEIWSVSVKNKTIKLLITGKGLLVNFADDASWGLRFTVGAKPERAPQLQLIDKDGNAKADFEFSTLPDKCLITLSALYCAIPQNLSSKINLPDDFLKRAVYFKDAIYRIDINQNSSEIIYSADEPVIDAIRFSFIGNRLLFINRYDKK